MRIYGEHFVRVALFPPRFQAVPWETSAPLSREIYDRIRRTNYRTISPRNLVSSPLFSFSFCLNVF